MSARRAQLRAILITLAALVMAMVVGVTSGFAAPPPGAAPLRFSVPRLREKPTIDGQVQGREWTSALLLPALADQPDNLVQRQHTRIYLGWREGDLFVAVRHQPAVNTALEPTTAQDAAQIQTDDHLTLAVQSSAAGSGLNFYLWPDRIYAMAADIPVTTQWDGKITHDRTGWSAELRIPLAMLSVDPARESTLNLTASLHRTSQGLPVAALDADLKLSPRQLAVRFIEGGQFPGDKLQGVLTEIVNDGTEPATAALKFTLLDENGVIKTIDDPARALAPDSAARLQMTRPQKAGRYRVQYEVKTQDAWPLGSGEMSFEAPGPMSMSLTSFHLWRGGTFVRLSLASPDDGPNEMLADVTVKLFDAAGQNVKSQASGRASRPGNIELFVSTRDLPAGVYLIEATATLGGKTLATVRQRITKPEIPAWWEKR